MLQQWERAWESYEWQATGLWSGKATKDRKKKIKKQNTRVCCPPTNMGNKEKYILHNHLIFGKMQVCKYTYIFMYIYICLCKSQSPNEFPFCSWLEEKNLIIKMKRSQEKDYSIWGTLKYHLETKFKIQHVHFGIKNVIFIYTLKLNLWGSIFPAFQYWFFS